MKTHFKKLKNTNYLGSYDLEDGNGNHITISATITKVTKELVHDGQGGSNYHIIASFKECKPMIVNATNANAITKIAGSPYIEEWVGKQVNITVRKVKAFGEMKDALRISAATPVDINKLFELKKGKLPSKDVADSIEKAIKDGNQNDKVIKYLSDL